MFNIIIKYIALEGKFLGRRNREVNFHISETDFPVTIRSKDPELPACAGFKAPHMVAALADAARFIYVVAGLAYALNRLKMDVAFN